MAVGPTPAGHQAELNIIYAMVEDLSKQLTENRRVTEDIVSGLGRVRSRARERQFTNDEVLQEAAEEILSQESNLDTIISVLTEALDRAKTSRDANYQLLTAYARVLSTLLQHFHAYKQKHIADVSAWHHSYRAQLAEARAENSRLREQIWEMQEHAGRANAMLRQFRKQYDEDENRKERRVEARARRQEGARLAMPDVADDDLDAWSDDDDLVDPVEKERLREVERKQAEQAAAGLGSSSSQQGEDSEGEEGGIPGHHPGTGGGLGGVAMERELSGMPTPPPRPASTGSTGGHIG
ncbi:uncharacterized protein PG986_014871 [Apiospora aurea]|uniref:Uncharacterized protein n=1 Tax=Apiospora aurea TaxID=335848 RepID=A0ABR1PUI3_9PEZI